MTSALQPEMGLETFGRVAAVVATVWRHFFPLNVSMEAPPRLQDSAKDREIMMIMPREVPDSVLVEELHTFL